jgi:hypothetical protein
MIDDPLNRLSVKKGQDLPHAKLTDDDVRWIRRMVERRERLREEANKLSNANLAKQLGLHKNTVGRVTAGENWGHVA